MKGKANNSKYNRINRALVSSGIIRPGYRDNSPNGTTPVPELSIQGGAGDECPKIRVKIRGPNVQITEVAGNRVTTFSIAEGASCRELLARNVQMAISEDDRQRIEASASGILSSTLFT